MKDPPNGISFFLCTQPIQKKPNSLTELRLTVIMQLGRRFSERLTSALKWSMHPMIWLTVELGVWPVVSVRWSVPWRGWYSSRSSHFVHFFSFACLVLFALWWCLRNNTWRRLPSRRFTCLSMIIDLKSAKNSSSQALFTQFSFGYHYHHHHFKPSTASNGSKETIKNGFQWIHTNSMHTMLFFLGSLALWLTRSLILLLCSERSKSLWISSQSKSKWNTHMD